MTDNNCEDASSCENFQVAICLHCDRRLCLRHIIEHDKIVYADVDKLWKSIETTREQITTKSETSRIACDTLLSALDEWRVQELEKIEQMYHHKLQLIENREGFLNRFYQHLFEELERGARKPIERVQRQQNSNTAILNSSRQAVEKLRKESTQLEWGDFPRLSSVNTEDSPSEFSLTLIPVQNSTNCIEKSIEQQQTTTTSLPDNAKEPCTGRRLNRVVKMFSDVSSIKKSQEDLSKYIQNQGVDFKLPKLICAYLTAWNNTSKEHDKSLLLNEHISTVQRYLTKCKNDFDVLVGIQAFFHRNSIQGEKHEMMTFLLRFFLEHQFINHNLILQWYNGNDAHGYMGFEEAKRLAEPFVKLLSI